MKEAVPPRALAPLATALILWVAGKLLVPVPLSIDAVMSPMHLVGVLSFFLFWLLGTLGWGFFAAGYLGSSKTESSLGLAWGVAVQILFATITGHLGWIGENSTLWFTLFSFFGVVFGSPELAQVRLRGWVDNRFTGISVAFFAYVTAWLVLKASVPHFLTDPMFYHLLGPRLWYQAGKIVVDPRMPLAFQASFWEYLFIHGNALLAGPDGRGLIEVQLFGQWVHVLGWLGCVVYLSRLLERLSVPRAWAIFACILGGLASTGYWSIYQANNDWGASFLLFAGLLALFSSADSVKLKIAAGFLFGMAVGAKYSVVFAGVPVALALLFEFRRGWSFAMKSFGLIFIGLVLGEAPILIRNLLYVDSPVFPAFPTVFPSHLLSQTKVEWAPFGSTALQAFWPRMEYLVQHEKLILLFFVLSPWIVWLKNTKLRSISVAVWLAWGIFLLTVGNWNGMDDGTLVLRLMGPGLILAGALAVLCGKELIRAIPIPRTRGPMLAVFAVVISIPQFLLRTPWMPRPFSDIERAVFVERDQVVGGWNKAWLRMSTRPEDRIVSTGDNLLYYVANLDVASGTDDAGLDSEFRDSNNLTDYLMSLRSAGVTYIFDTPHFEQRYWSSLARNLNSLVLEHPETISFASPDGGWVVQLQALLESTIQGCPKTGPVPFNLIHLLK